jgi:DNA polymerase-3 subunit chi
VAEIGFYHLTRTGLDRALPRLLARTLEAKQRAMVLCGDASRLPAVSAALWGAEAAWLPHNATPDEDPDLQPIWLAAQDAPAPNGARFLFLVEGADTAQAGVFTRIFDLFDGRNDTAVAAARRRWTAAKSGGHVLTYWKQTDRGGWEKAA